MTFILLGDYYSVLNNYEYENKSILISALDWLSTPCRRVLGGKNISVLSITIEHPMSVARRVVTLFFSVLIFPIAVISIASLALKVMVIPDNEKYKIRAESNKTVKIYWRLMTSPNEQVVTILNERPQLAIRDDIITRLSVIDRESAAAYEREHRRLPELIQFIE